MTIVVSEHPQFLTAPGEVAVHEAAHAVAAIEFDIGFRYVRLARDGGEIKIDPAGASLHRGQFYAAVALGYAMVALAGHAAAPGSGLSHSDRKLLESAYFVGIAYDVSEAALHACAQDFVREHGAEITAVAYALQERGELTEAQVRAVMSGARTQS